MQMHCILKYISILENLTTYFHRIINHSIDLKLTNTQNGYLYSIPRFTFIEGSDTEYSTKGYGIKFYDKRPIVKTKMYLCIEEYN